MSDMHETQDLKTDLLRHLVEAASMKSDIDYLKHAQNELSSRLLVQMGEMGGDMKAIRTGLESVPNKIMECRSDMRREIERDFPSRIDAVQMEQRIEDKIIDGDNKLSGQLTTIEGKVNAMWVKIVTAVTVVLMFASLIGWVIHTILDII